MVDEISSNKDKLCSEIEYQHMLDHFLQQDTLYWSMLQYFITLQLAIFSGGYILFEKPRIILILFLIFAIYLNYLLKKIVDKTFKDRMVNLDRMKYYESDKKFALTYSSTEQGLGENVWNKLFQLFTIIYYLAILFSLFLPCI